MQHHYFENFLLITLSYYSAAKNHMLTRLTRGDHFTIYTDTKLSCCTPGTNNVMSIIPQYTFLNLF